MKEKTFNDLVTHFSSIVFIMTSQLCINSLAQYQQQQQQYGMPQQVVQQVVPQHQQQVVQQAIPQQQLHQQQVPHSYQNGQQVQYQQIGGQQVPHYQQQPQQGSNVLHDQSRIHDREHIKEHLHGAVGDQDLSKMSEEELQFHYFKMHDNDNNNKLDGSELIKSLIHWHVEESKHLGANAPPVGTTKVFTDIELEQMIDPILEMDDKNRDGFIDYPEFVAAQKARGF